MGELTYRRNLSSMVLVGSGSSFHRRSNEILVAAGKEPKQKRGPVAKPEAKKPSA